MTFYKATAETFDGDVSSAVFTTLAAANTYVELYRKDEDNMAVWIQEV